jgi:hypothetical protein
MKDAGPADWWIQIAFLYLNNNQIVQNTPRNRPSANDIIGLTSKPSFCRALISRAAQVDLKGELTIILVVINPIYEAINTSNDEAHPLMTY